VTDEHPDILTISEAAEIMRTSRRHVEHLCERGVIQHSRVGSRIIRIPLAGLKAAFPGLFPNEKKK